MEKINLVLLRNPEFYQFTSDVLAIVSTERAAAMEVQEERKKLKKAVDQMTALFKPKRGSATTEEVEAKDAKRDSLITGFALIVNGSTNHYDDAMGKHAERLHEHLKLYGGGSIARENYISETATITNLVNDWDTKPELAAALKALSFEGWKTAIHKANEDFNNAFLERNTEKGAATEEKLKQKRKDATQAWGDLRDHIAAHHLIKKGAEPYGKPMKELEVLIAHYAQLLKNRRGRNGSAEEEGEEEVAATLNEQPTAQ